MVMVLIVATAWLRVSFMPPIKRKNFYLEELLTALRILVSYRCLVSICLGRFIFLSVMVTPAWLWLLHMHCWFLIWILLIVQFSESFIWIEQVMTNEAPYGLACWSALAWNMLHRLFDPSKVSMSGTYRIWFCIWFFMDFSLLI